MGSRQLTSIHIAKVERIDLLEKIVDIRLEKRHIITIVITKRHFADMWLKLFYQRQVLNDKILIGISRYSEIAERLFHRHHIGNRKQLLVFILIINEGSFHITQHDRNLMPAIHTSDPIGRPSLIA